MSSLLAPAPAAVDARVVHHEWTPAQRWIFRAAFAYAALFAFDSVLDSGDGPRALHALLREPFTTWIGHHILGLAGRLQATTAGWVIADFLSSGIIALVVATVWTAAARRTEYVRLYGWFRIILRYYVGAVMMIYGGFKVIESQFPPIPLDHLSQPLGSLTPMGLLWAYMGYSTIYTSFAGLGESVGAFLLFFRRTTTAGALILTAVLSNVALINFAYDVPVKRLSANLLLAVIVLAAGDVQRLIRVFLRNESVASVDLDFRLGRRMRRFRAVAKPLLVGVATLVPMVVSFFVHQNLRRRSALYGVYDVARSDSTVPSATKAVGLARWRRVVFSGPTTMAVTTDGDSSRTFSVTIDTSRHRLETRQVAGHSVASLIYDRVGAADLHLRGRIDGDSIDALLHRLDERQVYRLLR